MNHVRCSRSVEDKCVTARSGVLWGNTVAGRQAAAYEFHSRRHAGRMGQTVSYGLVVGDGPILSCYAVHC